MKEHFLNDSGYYPYGDYDYVEYTEIKEDLKEIEKEKLKNKELEY